MVTYEPWAPSSASSVSSNILVELSLSLCADARHPCFGLTAWGENSAAELVKTWSLIVVLGKNVMSNYPSSTIHLHSRPDKSDFIKIYLSGSSIYTTIACD